MRVMFFNPTARGEEDFPIVEVEVSMSGSCDPTIARQIARGSAVPRIKLTPAVAIAQWVVDIIEVKRSNV